MEIYRVSVWSDMTDIMGTYAGGHTTLSGVIRGRMTIEAAWAMVSPPLVARIPYAFMPTLITLASARLNRAIST